MEPAATFENQVLSDIAKSMIEKFWEGNLTGFLTEDHGTEIKWLCGVFDRFRSAEVTADDLVFEAAAVRNRTWEKLNVGKWMNVPAEVKQVYAIASYIQIVGILNKKGQEDPIEKALEVTDMGILLGFPFRSISLTHIADILSKTLSRDGSTESPPAGTSKARKPLIEDGHVLINEVETVSKPSLELFYTKYLCEGRPVKLTGCIDHWPALKLWTDLDYIVRKAGCRTVPVELGEHYASDEYSQKLMRISEFVRDFMRDDADRIGYLAQHQLFDQVPELKSDIMEPDYCALSLDPDSETGTEINAWFGPGGTVSPLHFDPKNNLLCQVVGTKKVILHPPSDSPYLYPHEGSLLFNTSRVDVEKPSLEDFPEYEKATRTECLLKPGDVLFIPPRYWHHVRALENSFSVSFWWK